METNGPAVSVSNDLSDPVIVVYLKGAGMPGGRIEAGDIKYYTFDLTDRDRCTTAPIVALSLSGTVVARIAAPACLDRAFRLSDHVVP